MKLYERYYAGCYEELITYYPRYYRDVFEMVAILKAFGRLSDGLMDNIEQTHLNNFILTADLDTIKVWEEILEITYEETLTLDQRKSVVIARLMGYGHIGEPEIREIIAKYTENAVAVDFGGGIIYVTIDGEVFDETNLLKTLLKRIPTHLALNMEIQIERTFRQQIDVHFGGAAGAYFAPLPVSEDRTSETGLHVAYGGFLAPGNKGIPPEVNHASTGRTSGAGGVFYHTHTKSKLMG